MRKDWKSIWYWLCIGMMILWGFFFVLGTGVAMMPQTTNLWYILLAILCLIAIHLISKKKLNPPIFVRYQIMLTVGLYLFFTFYHG